MNRDFMKRALEIAALGVGKVNPNPLVGAVIVKDDKIIGEGYHQVFGGNHAEINAIASANGSLAGSSMYVTLEPCSHYGKTPPCVNAIMENGIREVYVAMEDPNPLVAGNGLKILKENGVLVHTGLMKEEALRLNEVFVKFITTSTPFCVMKTAMTLDGKIACHTGDSKWITNEKSRRFVHELRNKYLGIMVGVGTVLTDDPSLTCRLEKNARQPRRIIVDSNLRIPLHSKVLNDEQANLTIVATLKETDTDKVRAIESKGAKVIFVKAMDGKIDLKDLMFLLGKENIDGILLEGGGTLNFSALKSGIVDRVMSFIAPKIVGGASAPTPVEGRGIDLMNDAIQLENIRTEIFDEDFLIIGEVKKCLQD
ncbi:bifunctional diaminohydroxyphosphoribosylaminopyrimidine deaminase/5-amino-6-(5-phosphoribosylamino)uracil reductase RibD [Alkalibacter mobilis]|uniref:bifunctional diaminohydroxyphosphoribosylaminopyrimidine deaminase/5-amino-6-(5-phosphoribosylamino)uracil reductase RibD n=1 Tax=Alkalibacter mobilis TaxID=2787712 RepID=UPI00189C720B|nr:bifunctional diaminohydroxyphosphoribosylaminopyrimidine deaminase/5-amino-6-(5-phosphoribosylamino)uracil reductase RibD [Alkalibacter mobilis]MBF7096720.1 bifunctional diaminohydroxyphosphoribosylaminopyrimidine deaminase/5-amino-6-(5-phosphoribosylamino)uracil reductase RibD [Alkalibacter mobilis]